MDPNNDPKKRPMMEYVKYSGLGMQMIATLCLAAWGGMKLDAYFNVKNHLITIFLLLFAVISSIYFVVRSLINKG